MATHRPENSKTNTKTKKAKPAKVVAKTNWDQLIARSVKLEDRLLKKLKSRNMVRKLKVKMLAK
ncbi:hypothetical protein AB4Y96_24520 [Phyllobacterium sp. TAF24]|jgi:hypothetical protein|uniref:hypothetical protein n=1 Tax=unclassified Phyllobacterium TaxID=2638441 RepID=UPI0008845572|nr:hypothetical protein [Phyllobacterium sp. OV277]SDP66058.1 hypothetical protein SAMN05443582_107168 [Phyllobacterium sp. OV277]